MFRFPNSEHGTEGVDKVTEVERKQARLNKLTEQRREAAKELKAAKRKERRENEKKAAEEALKQETAEALELVRFAKAFEITIQGTKMTAYDWLVSRYAQCQKGGADG